MYGHFIFWLMSWIEGIDFYSEKQAEVLDSVPNGSGIDDSIVWDNDMFSACTPMPHTAVLLLCWTEPGASSMPVYICIPTVVSVSWLDWCVTKGWHSGISFLYTWYLKGIFGFLLVRFVQPIQHSVPGQSYQSAFETCCIPSWCMILEESAMGIFLFVNRWLDWCQNKV